MFEKYNGKIPCLLIGTNYENFISTISRSNDCHGHNTMKVYQLTSGKHLTYDEFNKACLQSTTTKSELLQKFTSEVRVPHQGTQFLLIVYTFIGFLCPFSHS